MASEEEEAVLLLQDDERPSQHPLVLNVGGTTVTTSLETLTTGRAANSRLAAWFKDYTIQGQPFFIDRSSKYFEYLLTWLRTDIVATTDPIEIQLLRAEAVYFRLERLVRRLTAVSMVGDASDSLGSRFTINLATFLQFFNLSERELIFDSFDLVGLPLAGFHLSGASFINARITDCTLKKANLSSANFSYAIFSNVNIEGTNFINSDLRYSNITSLVLNNANLEGCDLTLMDLRGCSLRGANLKRAKLNNANLSNIDFSSADFQGASLKNANVTGCRFSGSNLTGCDFSGIDFSGFDLTNANFTSCKFHGCRMLNTRFENSILANVDLSQMIIDGIILQGANLSKCDLRRVDLTKLDLAGCNLHGALTQHNADVVVSCGWEKGLMVDMLSNGLNIATFATEFAFGRCHVHPNNKVFAVGAYKVTPADQDCVQIYDISSTEVTLIKSINGLGRNPFSIAFNHDGSWLAASCTVGNISLVDTITWEKVRTIAGHTSYIWDMVFSHDDQNIVSVCNDKAILVRRVSNGEVVYRHTTTVEARCVLLLKDNETIIAGLSGGTLLICHIGDQNPTTIAAHTANVDSMALHSDGTVFVTGSDDRSIKLWDSATRTVLKTFQADDIVSSVIFSTDERSIIAGIKTNNITAFNIENGTKTLYSMHRGTGSQSYVWGLACSHPTNNANNSTYSFSE